MPAAPYDAVVVVSFGGPEGPEDVMPFLENVTRGRDVPRERLEEVAAQYEIFDGISPINAQSRTLVERLSKELADHGHDLPVYWGNRNWSPYLTDTVRQMADDGVRRALAFVTSAYSSYSSCRQYLDDIDRARAGVGDPAPRIDKIRQFWNHQGFIEPFRDHLRLALDDLAAVAPLAPETTSLVFTAHSLPSSMAASSDYVTQLEEAVALVADDVAPELPRALVWQSRSGPPHVPWLEPDVNEHIQELAAEGVEQAVVVPVGFVSDHQEVLYDLDTQALATAEQVGVRMRRIPTPLGDPRFIEMVRELIEERLDPAVAPRSLGVLGVRPVPCAEGCCPAPGRSR